MVDIESGFHGVDPLATVEYGNSEGVVAGLNARWAAYGELTSRPIDFYKLAYERLAIEPGSSILDIGTSSGHGIERMLETYPHYGPIIGLDPFDSPFKLQKRIDSSRGNENPMEFVVGSVDELPFPDNSFDNVFALFSLYYSLDPNKALSEIRRVTKPEGRIAISTSGLGNKPWHREFERLIGADMYYRHAVTIDTPPKPGSRFDFTVARRLIAKQFDIAEIVPQLDNLTIKNEEDYITYELSILSAKDILPPLPQGVWQDAQDRIVRTFVMDTIAQQGYFADPVERYLFSALNSK